MSTAGTRSVTGTNVTPLAAAAFVDLKTPPLAPIYMVLPLASPGSTATLSTRPPAEPVAAAVNDWGASGVHGTFSAAVPLLCAVRGATAIPIESSHSMTRRRVFAFCLSPCCCMIRSRPFPPPRMLRTGECSADYLAQKKGIRPVTETVTLLNGQTLSHIPGKILPIPLDRPLQPFLKSNQRLIPEGLTRR